MNARMLLKEAPSRRNVALDGEHPDVIIDDIRNRPRPDAHVIVPANEKGEVGKSTIALHLCVALADAGLSVTAIDLDRRQQTSSRALLNREATGRRLGIDLPVPKQQVLQIQSGSMLCQEINRVGIDADIVVIDVAGSDSPIARRAIPIADTLVTPVNGSFVDLDLLGCFHPVTLDLVGQGCFAVAVNELRAARERKGLPGLDWVVLQNRLRRDASQNAVRVEISLGKLAAHAGFRLGRGLGERVAYRELFHPGLTHLDMRRIPDLAGTKIDANREIHALVADLALIPMIRRSRTSRLSQPLDCI